MPFAQTQTAPQRWRSRLGRFFGGLSIIYGLGLSAFLLLRLLVGQPRSDYFEHVEMINTILHLLLFPAPLALLILLWRRRWWLALSTLPPLLLLVVTFGPRFLPRAVAAVPADAPQITLLTFNLHSDWTAHYPEPLVEVILEADADVVAVQELSEPAAADLQAALADAYPYMALHPHELYAFAGQGVFSRYPILEDEYWRHEDDDLDSVSKGHQRVVLDVAGTRLVLYNTHPMNPFLRANPLRLLTGEGFSANINNLDITDLLDRAAGESGPVVLAGDFNLTELNSPYQRLVEHYTDTFREVGWGFGFTYPDWNQYAAPDIRDIRIPMFPLARLDYVFHNAQVAGLEATVWPSAGSSDHRPVLVRLALLPQDD